MKKEIVIDGEIVYLKKDWFGWRVIEPPKRWYHYIFGHKRNFFFLLAILIIALALYFGVNEMISSYRIIAENPCSFCIKKSIINISKIT